MGQVAAPTLAPTRMPEPQWQTRSEEKKGGGPYARHPRPYTFSLLALALYVTLAVALTFPLALQAGNALLATDSNALNDSYLSIWIFGWESHQLLIDPLHLFEGNIFYPFPHTLAFNEVILPEALMYLPLHLASGNPLLAYNLVVLAQFPLNGLAMYLFALDWMRRNRGRTRVQPTHAPALLAGIIFAFCTYKLGEIRHVQLLAAQWMPLALMYLGRGLRRPTLRHAFLTALFFVLNALSSLYYALFLGIAMALYVVIDFAVRGCRLTRSHLVFAASASGIALLLLLPFVLPFVQLEREFHFSAGRNPGLFAARPASYLATLPGNWLYGDWTRDFLVASKGQPLFPGFVVLVLAIIGLATQHWRKVAFLLLLTLTGFALSFGPVLFLGRDLVPAVIFPLPYHFLSRLIPPLNSLNAPARFSVLVMLGLALLAAYGAGWLASRLHQFSRAVLVACAVLILLEYASIPLKLAPVAAGATISPVYRFLAAQPPGQAVVEVPMGLPTFADQDKHVEYTYNSLYHWQPLVNGYSTFIPLEYYALVADMRSFPSAATVQRLKNWGAVYVVIHSDRIKAAAQIRAKLDALPGIERVQDFDEIWLYRLK